MQCGIPAMAWSGGKLCYVGFFDNHYDNVNYACGFTTCSSI